MSNSFSETDGTETVFGARLFATLATAFPEDFGAFIFMTFFVVRPSLFRMAVFFEGIVKSLMLICGARTDPISRDDS
jgi:hypothetical protein